jgi:heme-degrading monooxygenase HmoA
MAGADITSAQCPVCEDRSVRDDAARATSKSARHRSGFSTDAPASARRPGGTMIARIWRGITLAEKADAYIDYLNETGLKAYAETPGNRGVQVLRRLQGEHCEIVLISHWESMDAVRAFAGKNPERSVYYPEDEQYLLEMEPLVRHYDVAEQIPPDEAAQKKVRAKS